MAKTEQKVPADGVHVKECVLSGGEWAVTTETWQGGECVATNVTGIHAESFAEQPHVYEQDHPVEVAAIRAAGG